ncbi:MAG TPA: FAD-dependent oxidoreductase, partial [Limnochordia bacterium]|nr:FAD-dependent oxidoreductase [Limnochordia bacterium]
KAVFPFRGNGRARCLGEVEGSVKVLADAATDRLLGVHIIGPRAGELIAVGRVPNTAGLGLESAGITVDARGRIPVDDRFATAAPGVYAIGDVIAGPMLAHKAEREGVACVEGLAGKPVRVDYAALPAVCYTEPEIAAVGRTEAQLKAEGIAYRKAAFPFRGNGRARCLGEVEGSVKLLADAATDRLLGVHIIGPRAGELIAEATAAMAFGASSEDLTQVIHAHPTLAEALKEAAQKLLE